MSQERGSTASHLLAFVAGAVAGAVVALLTAPKAGRETREHVRTWARDLASRSSRAARDAFDETLRDIRSDRPGDPRA